MIMSGFMLLICTVPEGIAIALQAHYQMGLPTHDAILAGVKMMALMLVTGFVLQRVGLFIMKRRRKSPRSSWE